MEWMRLYRGIVHSQPSSIVWCRSGQQVSRCLHPFLFLHDFFLLCFLCLRQLRFEQRGGRSFSWYLLVLSLQVTFDSAMNDDRKSGLAERWNTLYLPLTRSSSFQPLALHRFPATMNKEHCKTMWSVCVSLWGWLYLFLFLSVVAVASWVLAQLSAPAMDAERSWMSLNLWHKERERERECVCVCVMWWERESEWVWETESKLRENYVIHWKTVWQPLLTSYSSFDGTVKSKILLSFLAMTPRVIHACRDEMMKLLRLARRDRDEWVRLFASVLGSFPEDQTVSLESDSSASDVLEELGEMCEYNLTNHVVHIWKNIL